MSAPTRDYYSVMVCSIRKIHRSRKQLQHIFSEGMWCACDARVLRGRGCCCVWENATHYNRRQLV